MSCDQGVVCIEWSVALNCKSMLNKFEDYCCYIYVTYLNVFLVSVLFWMSINMESYFLWSGKYFFVDSPHANSDDKDRKYCGLDHESVPRVDSCSSISNDSAKQITSVKNFKPVKALSIFRKFWNLFIFQDHFLK